MAKKIMAVDDDSDCLQSIRQALEHTDGEYKVTCVSSGVRCLELLENNEIPDLILLDIMMPEMSGWETLKILQENLSWRDIPVVFLTSRTDKIAKNTGNFLAADYIEKPFDIDDLKKRIDEVLKSSGHLQK
ncbi:response regulator with CheY-like receiver domain and winged-helix DNA-binding domain [Thermoplasmatales archaeon SCGC AB-540-F20]|nr:response regulator with CheY-like receiver domain and winged-helix DNA-binding domain [Thermoplasmatales archaeon SCGC AB-540-F20]